MKAEREDLTASSKLSFRELEALTRTLLTVLLAFLAASIAGEESLSLQSFAQFNVELEQRAGNAHLHCVGLPIDAAAGDARDHIEGAGGLGGLQRTTCRAALCLGDEVFVELAAIDGEIALAGTQENASHARFATSGAVILN